MSEVKNLFKDGYSKVEAKKIEEFRDYVLANLRYEGFHITKEEFDSFHKVYPEVVLADLKIFLKRE